MKGSISDFLVLKHGYRRRLTMHGCSKARCVPLPKIQRADACHHLETLLSPRLWRVLRQESQNLSLYSVPDRLLCTYSGRCPTSSLAYFSQLQLQWLIVNEFPCVFLSIAPKVVDDDLSML